MSFFLFFSDHFFFFHLFLFVFILDGELFMSSEQKKNSPKERKKANKKIEVNYHKLRNERLDKDFIKVDFAAWKAEDARRRLPRQTDNSGSKNIHYILKTGTSMINKIVLFILFHNQNNYLTHFLSYLNSSYLVSFRFILFHFI